MTWDPNRLLTPKEIQDAGGPAPRSLERMRVTGGGPRFTRIGPKIIRYRADHYLAWIEANSFASTADENASAPNA